MIARVGCDDFYVRPLDEEAVRLAALCLVVDAHGLVDRQPRIDGVVTDEVPVAHPRSAEVADSAVVGEGSGGGELFGDAFGEGVGLGNGEEWRACADGFEDGRVDVAELVGRLDGSGLVAGLVFETGGVAGVLCPGGGCSEAGGDDDVVFFPLREVADFEPEAWGEIGELFMECGGVPETATVRERPRL